MFIIFILPIAMLFTVFIPMGFMLTVMLFIVLILIAFTLPMFRAFMLFIGIA